MAGALQTTSNPTNTSYLYQVHFTKKLLPHIMDNLVLQQFAQTEDIPAKSGVKSIRFFKRRPADTTSIATLSEGVPITTLSEVSIGYVDCSLTQTGQVGKISDIRNWTDMFSVLQQNIEAYGEDAALKFDTTARDVIIAGMLNNDSQKLERFSGVTPTGDSSTDWASLDALSAANGKLTRAAMLGLATQMRAHKIPTIKGGMYAAVVPPQVLHDIRQDEDWMAAATQVDTKNLYKWSQITIDGIQYVEHTNPFIEDETYGTHDAAGDIYSIPVFGRGAFGCPKLSGTGSAVAPKIIINDKPDKTDPLNQYITVGWKAYWNAVLLKVTGLTDSAGSAVTDVPHCGIMRCKSTFA
jgi:N4-gp56 family major capsid protein